MLPWCQVEQMRGELLVVEVPGPWQDSEKSCKIRVVHPVQGGGGMMEFFHKEMATLPNAQMISPYASQLS